MGPIQHFVSFPKNDEMLKMAINIFYTFRNLTSHPCSQMLKWNIVTAEGFSHIFSHSFKFLSRKYLLSIMRYSWMSEWYGNTFFLKKNICKFWPKMKTQVVGFDLEKGFCLGLLTFQPFDAHSRNIFFSQISIIFFRFCVWYVLSFSENGLHLSCHTNKHWHN